MNRTHRVRRWTVAVALLFSILASLLVLDPARAQQFADSITEAEAHALATLASYSQSGSLVQEGLERLGFTPPATPAEWSQWPDIRKLECATVAAKNAMPQGGERLLALMSAQMAREYEAILYEPALAPFASLADEAVTIDFKNAPATPSRERLAPEIENAIRTLAKYSEGNHSGQISTLTRFGLSEVEAYEVLRRSESVEEAFLDGFSRAPGSSRSEGLARSIRFERLNYQALEFEPAMQPFLQPVPLQEQVRKAKPQAPPASSWAAPKYLDFVGEHYPTRFSRGFKLARAWAGGFGGVIVGNDVTSDIQPGPGARLRLVQTPESPESAKIELSLDGDATTASLGPVPLEDAVAGYQMVFGETPSWSPGEVLGLVGLYDQVPVADSRDGRILRKGGLFKVVLHPSLAGLDLGWSVLVSDALPIMKNQLRGLLMEHSGEEGVDALEVLFDNRLTNWKITDAPTRISVRQGALVVTRADIDEVDAVPVASALLSLQPFSDRLSFAIPRGWAKEARRQFREGLPYLLDSSPDFRRLNQLVAVLAVLRWAKAGNVPVEAPHVELRPESAPESIAIFDDGFAVPDLPDGSGDGVAPVWEAVDRGLQAALLSLPLPAQEAYGRLDSKLQELLIAQRSLLEEAIRVPKNIDSLERTVLSEINPALRDLLTEEGRAEQQFEDAPAGSEEAGKWSDRVDSVRGHIRALIEETLPNEARQLRLRMQAATERHRSAESGSPEEEMWLKEKLESTQDYRRLLSSLLPEDSVLGKGFRQGMKLEAVEAEISETEITLDAFHPAVSYWRRLQRYAPLER